MKIVFQLVIFCFVISLMSCKSGSDDSKTLPIADLPKVLQAKLIEANDGDVLLLPEGTFEFKRSVSLNDTPNITVKGAGKGKTVLSFKNQIEGAEGMLFKNVKGLTLEGFTVVDSKGDAIKVQDCTNVTMRDLEATWTTGKDPNNGAYGLYPVSSTNVLMEGCEASFAMDAGIYVGQSTNVVVRNNYVHDNVAGLEIENTINGEVYKNRAINNTGGMLIFDMPDLPQVNGDRIKFYENVMENNNGENFAPAGMVVSTIPPGSGMILMSHSNIEVYNNVIKNHKTLGIAINSWLFTRTPYKNEEFDPYATNIHIHNNTITGTEGPVDQSTQYGQLLTSLFGGKAFDIVTDGIYKPGTEQSNGAPTSYCIRDNGDISFVNLNIGKGGMEKIGQFIDNNLSVFDCELETFDTSNHDEWLVIN